MIFFILRPAEESYRFFVGTACTAVSSGNCKNSLFCDDDNFKLISLQLLIVLTFVPVTSFNHGGCLGDGPPEILLKFLDILLPNSL